LELRVDGSIIIIASFTRPIPTHPFHIRNNDKTTTLKQLNPQINTMKFFSAITGAALGFSSLASAITGP
jgi:hypothetical protein